VELIAHYGTRLDRPLTPQQSLWLRIRATAYTSLLDGDKAILRDLLAAEHAQREQVRFGRTEA